jgi:hypothetical protein
MRSHGLGKVIPTGLTENRRLVLAAASGPITLTAGLKHFI